MYVNISKINISDSTEENIQEMLTMVFCACDNGEYDGLLSLDEFTGEVCGVNFIFSIKTKVVIH